MKRIIYLVLILSLFLFCASKQEKVERIIEDGVEVVVNHIKPYKIKGKLASLSLEKEFSIDTESDETAGLGITDIEGFDIDSKGNIYIFIPSRIMEKLVYKFDSNGKYITSFGPRGQGPGEIQSASIFGIAKDDEIPVVDANGLKLVFFDKNGNFINETRLKFKIAQGYVLPLENGNYLIRTLEGEFRKPSEGPPKEGVAWVLCLCDPDLNLIKYIDRLHHSGPLLAKRSPHMMPVYFWEVSDGKIFVGNSQWGYEIRVFDLNGNLIKKIRKEYKPVKFPESIIEQEAWLNREYPKFLPPFQRLFFTDDDGRFFVMTFEKEKNSKKYTFDIFNADGVFIGRKNMDIYVERYTNRFPLYAVAKDHRLYCLREKESGYKELVVYRMKWE